MRLKTPVRRLVRPGANLAKVRRLADDINARLDPAAPTLVTTETEALYRSMNDRALETLRAAFTLDRDQAVPRPAAARLRAFCQSRIDLITRILEAREPCEATP